jgi:Tol biopolymer transport system component
MNHPRTSLLLLTVAIAVILVAGTVALRDLAGGGSAVAPAEGNAVLVFAEFGRSADRIYSAPASNPSQRTLLLTAEHADGWGINPAPSMAGSLLAYVALPPGSPGRGAPAELWVLDLASGDRTRLARDADPFVAPVFDRDGAFIAYRSLGPDGEQRVSRADLERGTRRVLHRYSGEFGVFPVAQGTDGDALFIELSTAGTDLYRVDGDGNSELLLHASDEIARDWQLSPDGRSISFLAPEQVGERVVHRARLFALSGAAGELLLASDVGEQFAPVWGPGGTSLTVGREAYPAAIAAATIVSIDDGTVTMLAAPDQGFDAPLGWSHDGQYLAVRAFDGQTAFDPGSESMVVISLDGGRRAVAGTNELIFIGWITRG